MRYTGLYGLNARGKLISVVEGLRRMADEIEAEIQDIDHPTDPSSVLAAAKITVHTVIWGVANLDLDRVMVACFEAEREEEAKG